MLDNRESFCTCGFIDKIYIVEGQYYYTNDDSD